MSAKNPTLEELKRQQYAQATNVLAQNAANKALAGTAKTTAASGDHDGRGGKGQPTVQKATTGLLPKTYQCAG